MSVKNLAGFWIHCGMQYVLTATCGMNTEMVLEESMHAQSAF